MSRKGPAVRGSEDCFVSLRHYALLPLCLMCSGDTHVQVQLLQYMYNVVRG